MMEKQTKITVSSKLRFRRTSRSKESKNACESAGTSRWAWEIQLSMAPGLGVGPALG